MNCTKCGIELPSSAKFCLECGTRQGSHQAFYNWLAFISYSHKDSAAAKYIEAELKKYKLPLVIEQNNPALKKLRFDQIFRDENNFGNGSLEDQIQFGLQNSKFLIAICSPNYAKANSEGINWCDEEIKQFLSYHNNDETLIIPVIIDGVPHSDNECFPPSLLNLKSEDGKTKEALGIAGTAVHTLLADGVEKADLAPAEKAAKDELFDAIKARLLGLNYGAYKNYAHQEKYYKDYVDCNALPVGIRQLTDGAWEHTKHYKFIYREDLLDEVRFENGNGAVLRHSDSEEKEKIVDSFFFYDEQGKLLKIEDRDIHGKIARIQEFKKNYCVINFTDEKEDSSRLSATFSTSGDADRSEKKADIKSIRLVRDENGFVVSRTFHKYHDEMYPVSDNGGVYGMEYENDAKGRVVKLWYLDAESRRMCTKDGIAGKVYEYDSNDCRSVESFVDAEGSLVFNANGFAYETFRYDRYGNQIQADYCDTDMNPVIRKDGLARVLYEYDDAGNRVTVTHCGPDGGKVYSTDGYVTSRWEYDAAGNVSRVALFGLNDEPVTGKDGYSGFTMTHDSRNYMTEQAFFGTDGRPVLSKSEGIAKVAVVYDAAGHNIEGCFFNVDGSLMCRKNGEAITRKKYDEAGNAIEYACFGTDGQPVITEAGCHKVCWKHDIFGNPVEGTYYGTDDRLCLNKDGFAMIRVTYDSRGNELSMSYFGADGQKVLFKGCYATVRYMYDDRNNEIERAFYGLEDEPVLNEEGAHRIRSKHDAAGHQTERTFYGINDESILSKHGFFRESTVYNAYGDCTELSYHGLEGELVVETEHGFSRNTMKWERGAIVEGAQYGADGKLMLNEEGFAVFVSEYDRLGRKIGVRYYGTEMEPVLTGNGARVSLQYDARGNETEEAYFGLSGEPFVCSSDYSRVCVTYDERDQAVERVYYKPEGGTEREFLRTQYQYDGPGHVCEKKIIDLEGTRVIRYDEKDRVIERAQFDPDGKPVADKDGFIHMYNTYFEDGAIKSMKRYTPDGNYSIGCFDSRGNVIDYGFYKADGSLMNNENGWARQNKKYDDEKHCIENLRTFEDNTSHLMRYNAAGKLTEDAYFDGEGKLRVGAKGFARNVDTFDERGNLLESVYYGADGNRMLIRNYSRVVSAYDDRNRCVETAFFGLNDEPVMNMGGRHKWTAAYDDSGNKIEECSFGVNGEPVLQKDGYFRWTKTFDEKGACIQTIYFDIAGNELRRE